MSTDKRVTTDLIETLEDGRDGFAHAADRLAEADRSELSTKFREYAAQRANFSAELEKLAANYGDDIDENGSIAAAVHRGWMTFRDAISGSDPLGVLNAAEQGEDYAVAKYETALSEDISPQLRAVIQAQFIEVKSAHDYVKSMRNAVS